MKRHIRASLFSAFAPGLGQFINHRYFKGAVHMAAFNLVFAAIVILLVLDTLAIWPEISTENAFSWSLIWTFFRARGLMSYGLLALAGGGVWILSILDAYRDGKRPLPDLQKRG